MWRGTIAALLTLFALAALLGPAPEARAQEVETELDVYGSFRIGAGWLNDGNDGDLNVFDRASRVGFRGTLVPGDEGPGFLPEVYWQVESTVNLDQGSGSVANRNSYVGLRDDWGSLRFGFFDTPGREVGRAVERIFSRVGDQRNLTRVDDAQGGQDDREPGWDNRWGNSIRYETPRIRGFALDAQFASHFGDGFTNTTDGERAFSTKATFEEGPWEAGAAFETIDSDSPRLPFNEAAPTLFRVSGGYAADEYELGAMVQHGVDQQGLAGQDRTTFGGGASYTLTERALLHGQAYFAGEADNVDESSAAMLATELEYRVYPDMRLYLTLARTGNDDNARFQTTRGVISDGPVGENSTSASLLVRYDF